MFLRLLRDLPIEEKHGATAGRVFECLRYDDRSRDRKAWFIGDAGEECAAYTNRNAECDLYDTRESAEAEKDAW